MVVVVLCLVVCPPECRSKMTTIMATIRTIRVTGRRSSLVGLSATKDLVWWRPPLKTGFRTKLTVMGTTGSFTV